MEEEKKPTLQPAHPASVMNDILDHQISIAPEENKGAIQAQLLFRNGKEVAGAVTKGSHPGSYLLTSVGTMPTDLGPKPVLVEVHFLGFDVMQIQMFKDKGPDLSIPAGTKIPSGGRIPGLRG